MDIRALHILETPAMTELGFHQDLFIDSSYFHFFHFMLYVIIVVLSVDRIKEADLTNILYDLFAHTDGTDNTFILAIILYYIKAT